MRIRIEICDEEEIIIKCKNIDERIINIQKFLENNENKIELIKNDREYYVDLNDIIFFETDGNLVNAHTKDQIFKTKYKLYELENILPNFFLRVSKSSILNLNHIYAINYNITSSSVVEFNNSHKTVYVSRLYYKVLKNRMKGRILNEK